MRQTWKRVSIGDLGFLGGAYDHGGHHESFNKNKGKQGKNKGNKMVFRVFDLRVLPGFIFESHEFEPYFANYIFAEIPIRWMGRKF